MSEKRRAPAPPAEVRAQMERSSRAWSAAEGPVRAIENPAYIESDATAQGNRPSLPLPDYETLFPQKRHGVQGQPRWDNLIAEVHQKKREKPDLFLGEEMSVDGPEEQRTSQQPRPSSQLRESDWQRPADRVPQPQVYEAKPISSKRMPAPPKPDRLGFGTPIPRTSVEYSPRQGQSAAQAVQKPNASAPAGFVDAQTSREVLSGRERDGVGRAVSAYDETNIQPSVRPNITNKPGRDVRAEHPTKDMPTAKPRQKAVSRDGGKQAHVPATNSAQSNGPLSNKMDQRLKEEEVSLRRELASKGSWADNRFTGKVQEELTLEDKGMTADDFDQLFAAENPSDPFGSSHSDDAEKQFEAKYIDLNLQSPSQNLHLHKSKQMLKSLPASDSINVKSKQGTASHEGAAITTVVERLPSKETVTNAAFESHPIEWTEDPFGGDPFGRDPFRADPFARDSPRSSEPHRLSMDESRVQTEGASGGKNLLNAWVSPTEGQSVSAQNSTVGGPAVSLRRPHPVKPMSSAENQHTLSSPAVKEIKILDTKVSQIKVEDFDEGTGAYTQLTQEELITLVVKQQVELTKRKAKITELEEYIDNLLVRVIDEKPSILLGISSTSSA